MIDQTSIFREERGVSPCLLHGNERAVFLEWEKDNKSKEDKALLRRPHNAFGVETGKFSVESIGFLPTWKILAFDTETTGLPGRWDLPASAVENWPFVVELAFGVIEIDVQSLEIVNFEIKDFVIEPRGFEIPKEASDVHGIDTETAIVEGVPILFALEQFSKAVQECDALIAHNMSFDETVLAAEIHRLEPGEAKPKFSKLPKICTKEKSTDFCKIAKPNGRRGYKWPKLEELYSKLFGKEIENQHRADGDVLALGESFVELCRQKIIKIEEEVSKC